MNQKDSTSLRNWLTYEKYERVIRAPIPYSATDCIDLKNRAVAPFAAQDVANARYYHYLGTDENGVDVAAYMLYGWHTAVKIGALATFISFLIGLLFGLSAAYFRNDGLSVPVYKLFLYSITLGFGYFYIFIVPIGSILFKIFIFCSLIFLIYKLNIPNKKNNTIHIALDTILLRTMDTINSFPKILVLLSIAAILVKCQWWHIAILIGCIAWTSVARLARAETLRIKGLSFFEAAKASGLYDWSIIRNHILPNVLPSIWILLGFSVSSAIMVEASMSFIGLNIHEASWGLLLNQAHSNQALWWLAFFPGFAIFMTVLIFSVWAERKGN